MIVGESPATLYSLLTRHKADIKMFTVAITFTVLTHLISIWLPLSLLRATELRRMYIEDSNCCGTLCIMQLTLCLRVFPFINKQLLWKYVIRDKFLSKYMKFLSKYCFVKKRTIIWIETTNSTMKSEIRCGTAIFNWYRFLGQCRTTTII